MSADAAPARVVATPAALQAVAELRRLYPRLLFYQSGGCCAGSTPMCFPAGEFRIGDHDVLLGRIGDCPMYIDRRQHEVWQHTQLIVDVAAGEPEGFSLPAADENSHFTTLSRVFTPAELTALEQERP